jgi:hypothetical protein
MRYNDPQTRSDHWVPIERGPETPAPEALQTDGLARRRDALPSGFGPYEQSRLARQTGGIFFMLPLPEHNLVGRRPEVRYDADAMRPYLPDLSSRQDYLADRDKSPFRKTIAQVITELDPVSGPNGNPDPSLSKAEVRVSGFPIDRASLATEANRNLRKAAELLKLFESAQKALESVSEMRAREKSPRWRANYDLIYAQVLAYQVRLKEYGWYLAEFINTPRAIKNPLGPAHPTNEWNIGGVERLLKPELTRAEREKTDTLFRQIEKEYAGTPWGQRAKDELGRGYGIELREGYKNPASAAAMVPKF